MRAFRWIRMSGVVGLSLLLGTVSAAAAETDWQVNAVAGEPFGVGVLGEVLIDDFPADQPFVLTEEDQRIFYPVVVRTPLNNDSSVTKVKAYFLFRGEAPLKLKLGAHSPVKLIVVPKKDSEELRSMLRVWWERYPSQFLRQQKWHREPEALGTYLTGMLSRRLDLKLSDKNRHGSWSRRTGVFSNDWTHFAEFVIGTRSVKAALQRDTLLQNAGAVEIADQPLPDSVTLPAVDIPDDFTAREVEELAYHVPEECFYIRCADVSAYHWLHQAFGVLDVFSQGLQGVTSDYTIDNGTHAKLERQLGLREATAANALGPKTLKQLAIIGTDFFVREGAAIGIVFESQDSQAVSEWLKQEQNHVLEQEPQAKSQTVQIGETQGTFLTTPDHRIRSFRVSVGNFHLVTNSRKIAERFVEISKDDGSLGSLKEYQYTRAMKFPDERMGPVFVYLSDAFFRNFIGPQYRIEMTRRAKAAADLELVTFAQLAAKSEGVSTKSVADLVSAELLPASILERSDHSQPRLINGQVTDSVRGGRGTFLPIPDVNIERITKSESESYEKFTTLYRQVWRRVDPVALAITEKPSDKPGTTRIVFDLYVTPFVANQYGMLATFLPKPDQKRVPSPSGSLLFLDIVSPHFGRSNENDRKDLHLFAGLQDLDVPFTIENGAVIYPKTDEKDMPGYLGQSKTSGLMQFLVSQKEQDETERDEEGYGQHKRKWSRLWNGDWFAVARNPEVLQVVTPHLKMESAPRPAQMRFTVGDISTAKIRNSVEASAYVETRRMSADTAMYLHRLMQQLHVSPKDVFESAKQLHDGRLLDPLGGEFQWTAGKEDNSASAWVSTHWPHRSRYEDTAIPEAFSHPFVDGMRGGLVELSLSGTQRSLSSHVELVVPKQAAFSGPSQSKD